LIVCRSDKIITPKALDAFRTVMEDLDFVPLYEVFDELNLDGSYYIYELEEELGIGSEYWSDGEEDHDHDERDAEGSNESIGPHIMPDDGEADDVNDSEGSNES